LKTVLNWIDCEVARAEAVVRADEGPQKLHQPTVEHHKGQIVALRKARAFLQMQENNPPGPIEPLKKDYTVTVSWRVLTLIVAIMTIATI